MLAARVAVLGTGVAAERVIAHLGAAGVGWIAAEPVLHACVDPAQPDVTVVGLGDAADDGALGAVVVVAAACEAAAIAIEPLGARAQHVFWIADGHAGATPPCPRCAAVAVPSMPAVPAELLALRDAFLGTAIATEVVKALLAIGTGLAGVVLSYDPTSAMVSSTAVARGAGCGCGGADTGD